MALVEEAIAYAARFHAGQTRKGSTLPYIWHPLGVARLLVDHGCENPVVVAGILHDLVEDTPVTSAEITERFGAEIGAIVDGCSEPDKSLAWEERKRRTLAKLPGAPPEVRLVSAADKIDNLRSILIDRETLGDRIWDRFRRGREKQEWYYRGVAEALGDGHPLFRLVTDHVDRVFG